MKQFDRFADLASRRFLRGLTLSSEPAVLLGEAMDRALWINAAGIALFAGGQADSRLRLNGSLPFMRQIRAAARQIEKGETIRRGFRIAAGLSLRFAECELARVDAGEGESAILLRSPEWGRRNPRREHALAREAVEALDSLAGPCAILDRHGLALAAGAKFAEAEYDESQIENLAAEAARERAPLLRRSLEGGAEIALARIHDSPARFLALLELGAEADASASAPGSTLACVSDSTPASASGADALGGFVPGRRESPDSARGADPPEAGPLGGFASEGEETRASASAPASDSMTASNADSAADFASASAPLAAPGADALGGFVPARAQATDSAAAPASAADSPADARADALTGEEKNAFLEIGRELESESAPAIASGARDSASPPSGARLAETESESGGRSARRMNREGEFAGDMLEIAAIERGEIALKPESLDPARIASQALASLGPRARARRVFLRTSLSSSLEPIRADARCLRRMLLALASSALGRSSENGQIIVSARREPNGETRISIRDAGRPMSEEEINGALFPLRAGAGEGNRPEGRFGAGLSLACALARANGAKFEFSSAPRRGSVATVRFPKSPSRALAAPGASAPLAASDPK